MIEKLKWDEQPEDAAKEVQNLIDQLVDAVNELQEAFESIHPYLKYKDLNKTPVDPYAEQRKWIGKLCRFWAEYKENAYIGILSDITTSGRYLPENAICSYENCEPVKPDDDIIYKGE